MYNWDATRLLSTGTYPYYCEGAPGNSTGPGDLFGFMSIDINGNTFTVNAHFQDGTIASTWTFTKP